MKNILATLATMLALTSAYPQGGTSLASTPQGATGLKPPQATVTGQQQKGKDLPQKAVVARPVSVQLFVGSQGLGADLRYSLLPRLSGRAGFGIIPVTVNNVFGFSSFTTNNQMSARFSNVHLLADYSPFKSQRFRLVGGAAYLLKGNASVLITPSGNYQFGNSTVSSDQVGTLNAAVQWKGLAPYFGFSVFRAFPNKFFNTNIDIGTYYLSSPGTSLTGTKMLSDNSSQEPQFAQNMQGYRWMPVLQFNFNFRIR